MSTSSSAPARRTNEATDAPRPLLRILSLGAGVQSTTVLLMALHGEFPDRLDGAIFADTGWEPKAVYEHLDWLEARAREGRIPVYRVSAGNLRQDLLDAVAEKRPRVANPPFYVRNRDEAGEYKTPDQGGMLWRKCTKAYKIDPIRASSARWQRPRTGPPVSRPAAWSSGSESAPTSGGGCGRVMSPTSSTATRWSSAA